MSKHTVRIDSGASHLVVCGACPYTAGPFPTREIAQGIRAEHTRFHYLEREAARALFSREAR